MLVHVLAIQVTLYNYFSNVFKPLNFVFIGGSLVVKKGDKRILVGVTSFVSESGCGLGTGFARVTFFIPWIKSNL